MNKTLLNTTKLAVVLFFTPIVLFGYKTKVEEKPSVVFEQFITPPAEARPFVRWWWNGNKLTKEEIERELEVLRQAGFGGVEINPIALPNGAEKVDVKALNWMSDEWIDMFVHACKKTKEKGMIADIIVGTGWPFGGEFLSKDETCQRVVAHSIEYKNNRKIHLSANELLENLIVANFGFKNIEQNKKINSKLIFIKLIPLNIQSTDDIIDLSGHIDKEGNIDFSIGSDGTYFLSYGFLQKGYRQVVLGSPGGAGPVMDHYKKEVTLAYLSRLKMITEKTGIPLNELIRALFCDSIELSGANWTDGLTRLFLAKYGYSLEPWMPFIFYPEQEGYAPSNFSADFNQKLKQVRFDYNSFLVELFLSEFTATFQDFCTDNGVKCRYQAYGYPFLMGLLEGYMNVDIPESNNWLYSADMNAEKWQWSQEQGDMIWNMYAAAGGHLSGKNIISCEAMTNVRGVFKTSLEEIKQHDDMNFITGINHSILHGFNYSPPEVGFPGWVKFGTYFSEHNTWWPYLKHWTQYNARLSYVFQNSQPQKTIAIIGPTADHWGNNGLNRIFFHMKPSYLYKMWEPISQLGYSCEYINQNVLEGASMKDSSITFGNMNYKLLVLAGLQSLSPKAALQIKAFAESGGKIVVIGQLPLKSLGFKDSEQNEILVKTTMEVLSKSHPDAFIHVNQPAYTNMLSWVNGFLKTSGIEPDVNISHPDNKVYQIHQSTSNKEIYFFTNIHRFDAAQFTAQFPVEGKYPYVWNPETGERTPFAYQSKPNELNITLQPLQSILLVFENEKPVIETQFHNTKIKTAQVVENAWMVTGKQVDGQIFNWELTELIDFSTSKDELQNSFGGTLIYKTTINNTDGFTHIDLGNVNKGITALYVNGKKAGIHWYGRALYPVEELLKADSNEIEIHYTTVLSNYCKSIDNPAANNWTNKYKDKVRTGIEGPVRLLKYQ